MNRTFVLCQTNLISLKIIMVHKQVTAEGTKNLESASFAIEDDAIPASFGVVSQQYRTTDDLGI